LNGDLLGACLVVPDGASAGCATIEQLAVQRDAAATERAACAAHLLLRSMDECRQLHQRYAIVPPLPPLLSVEGAQWLQAAGFAPIVHDSAPAEVVAYARTTPGSVYRAVE